MLTGHHRGTKHKRKFACQGALVSVISLLQHCIILWLLFFIVEITCFLCSMRVFDIQASSSSPRLPLHQISSLLWSPLLSEPMEINCILNQSLTLLICAWSINESITQLIWCPGNRSFWLGTWGKYAPKIPQK